MHLNARGPVCCCGLEVVGGDFQNVPLTFDSQVTIEIADHSRLHSFGENQVVVGATSAAEMANEVRAVGS